MGKRLCSVAQLSLLLLLTLSLQLPARGSYLLVTRFHFYENLLHSFINTSASPFTALCCDGHNCTGPCNTVLNYCFKEVGTVNSFDDDSTILDDCVGNRRTLTELVEPSDSIDFSDPPLSISGSPTWSSLPSRGDVWPGGIQLFVRSMSDGQIVDYLSTNVYLKPGENLTDRTLTGHHFGNNITFTVSFFLACTFNFYGENCSTFCRPSSSKEEGFYSCDSEGVKICKDHFNGSDCNMCENGYEYPNCQPDVCRAIDPCGREGNCTSIGSDSYKCTCNQGFHGVNCTEPDPDLCRLLDPCQAGNCTNTGPDGYRCTCNDGFTGVNCTTEVETEKNPGLEMSYLLLLILAGVVGILAPVVILCPLLFILCLTALGSWRNKKKDYVNNPLYGEASAPASGTSTFRSETGTDPSSAAEMIHVHSDCSTDTLSPPRMSCEEEPNYDIIPGDSGKAPGTQVSLVASSFPDTFKSDDNNSYYTLSISTNESICPYNYLPDYDVPPPSLPIRGLPPSVPNSFRSECGHSFLEMTGLAVDEESQTYYKHPLPHDPVTHNDLTRTPESNGAPWVPPPLPVNQQRRLALQRSKTIAGHSGYSRTGVRHSNSFKSRSRHRHHHHQHQHHHHHHHRRLCKSGSAGAGYVSSRQYQYLLEMPKITPYGQRRGLPPVPPHGIRSNHVTSSCEDRRALTLGSESSANYSQFMSDHSQMFGSESTVIGSEMNNSGWSMSTEGITVPSPYLVPPKIVVDDKPHYDEVPVVLPEGAYGGLVPKKPDYGHYDVPRKE